MKTTYRIVVRDCNQWDERTGEHSLLRECGHKHRTLAGAVACWQHLSCIRKDPISGEMRWSADWYHARIEDTAAIGPPEYAQYVDYHGHIHAILGGIPAW